MFATWRRVVHAAGAAADAVVVAGERDCWPFDAGLKRGGARNRTYSAGTCERSGADGCARHHGADGSTRFPNSGAFAHGDGRRR